MHIVGNSRLEDTSVFKTDVRQVFDFIRYSEDKEKLLELVESDSSYTAMEDDAVDVVSEYTNILQLMNVEDYKMKKGKTDVCKALRDLVDDSKAEGQAVGIELTKLENAKNLLDILSDEIISERIRLPLSTVQALRAEQVNM